MAGPWEKYATPSQAPTGKPWEKYGAAPATSPSLAQDANAPSPSSLPSKPLDLSSSLQNALQVAGRWADTPLMPAKMQAETQIGNINPAAAMSTPRNLAIGMLGSGEGLGIDLAMTALTAPETIQGAKDIMTPGRRLKGAGELGFAAPLGLGAVGNIGRDAATLGGIKLAGSTVDEMSHNWLFNSAGESKQFVKATQQGVQAHVGMLKQGLELADRAAIPQGQMGSVNLTDLAPEIDRISQKYKGPLDIPLDRFDRAVNSFNLISGKSPYVNLETLLDIRTGIGKLWHSTRDSMDAAAVAELRDLLTSKARERATELKQLPQFNSYNKVWKNLLEYEDQGVLGKLLNAPSGKPYFDMLNDKTLGPQLRQLNRDLSEQAGVQGSGQRVFPEDYFKKLAADHKDIYDFTNRRGGIRGVFSAVAQRPLAGVTGAFTGGAVGSAVGHPILGMLGGASAGLSLADRIAAIRNMSRLGGAKGIEGVMGPRVEPDFGGGLSGRVIDELSKGPSGGDRPFIPGGRGRKYREEDPQTRQFRENNPGSNVTVTPESFKKKSIVSSPEDIRKMQAEDRRGYSPKLTEKAMEVERLRKEKGKPVGTQSRETDKKLGISDEGNVKAQTEQERIMDAFLKGYSAKPSQEQLERAMELQKSFERRKKPRD